MCKCLLYAGTTDGLVILRFDRERRLEIVTHMLQGNAVRAIALHQFEPQIAYVGCALPGGGLYRIQNAGQSIKQLGFGDCWVWDVALHPKNPKIFWVGTEPPMLYFTRNKGRTFTAFEGIEKLPSRMRWKFFFDPFHAGHIHGLAVHPKRPKRLFAGVEQGALIYSYDGGTTWMEALVGYDLHRVAIDPSNPDRIFAGAGEGLFISEDVGQTWKPTSIFRGKYIHSILFDPKNPQRVYIYVGKEGAPLYRSDDYGENWHRIKDRLPTAGPADNLTIHPIETNVLFYAGDVTKKSSRLFVSFDSGETWESLSLNLPKIWRLKIGKQLKLHA